MRAVSAMLACGTFLASAQSAAPTVFAPFAFTSSSQLMDIAFGADRRTMYATLIEPKGRRSIVESHRVGGSWTSPKAVSFSGTWRDLEEVLAPDASYMIFASNRPTVAGGPALDAYYRRRYRHARGGNLWIVHRSGASWGAPERLPDAVNANTSTFSPAVAADGTLYFMRASGAKGLFNLFVSHPVGGRYIRSQSAPFADNQRDENDPTVAADDSFVIFSSTRAPVPKGNDDLFITYQHDGTWSIPRDMGRPINAGGDDFEARLTPDAKGIYYSSAVDPTNLSAPIDPNAPGQVLFLPLH
jgi:hypothetical protein